jgi:hypothetical protein
VQPFRAVSVASKTVGKDMLQLGFSENVGNKHTKSNGASSFSLLNYGFRANFTDFGGSNARWLQPKNGLVIRGL